MFQDYAVIIVGRTFLESSEKFQNCDALTIYYRVCENLPMEWFAEARITFALIPVLSLFIYLWLPWLLIELEEEKELQRDTKQHSSSCLLKEQACNSGIRAS